MLSLFDAEGFVSFVTVLCFIALILVYVFAGTTGVKNFWDNTFPCWMITGVSIVVFVSLAALAHFMFGMAGAILAAITMLTITVLFEVITAGRYIELAKRNDRPSTVANCVFMASAPIASAAWATWVAIGLDQSSVYSNIVMTIMAVVSISCLMGTIVALLASYSDSEPDTTIRQLSGVRDVSYIVHAVFIGVGLYYGASNVFTIIQHAKSGNIATPDVLLIALPLLSLGLYVIRSAIGTHIRRQTHN